MAAGDPINSVARVIVLALGGIGIAGVLAVSLLASAGSSTDSTLLLRADPVVADDTSEPTAAVEGGGVEVLGTPALTATGTTAPPSSAVTVPEIVP